MLMTVFPVRLRIASIIALCGLLPAVASAQLPVTMPNGVASGDVTQNSAVLWTRSTALGNVNFQIATDPAFTNIVSSGVQSVTDPLVPVKVGVSGLAAGTQYYYRAVDSTNSTVTGQFRTVTPTGQVRGLRFGMSGDSRGELAPYSSLKNVAGRNLDFMVNLGDTIYADVASPGLNQPQAISLNDYRAKHTEVYEARGGLNAWANVRASTSVLSMIDDHEVTNDFAGGATIGSDPRFAPYGPASSLINDSDLYERGIQAFHEYNPIADETWANTGTDARTDGETKLYRSRTWGRDAAFHMVDARSFRDQGLPAADFANPATWGPYIASTFTPGRTMVGNAQLDQLKADVLAAKAAGTAWQFISIPEPTQNLGVLGASDRWEGYGAERDAFIGWLRANDVNNVVFLAADIHGSLVNSITYRPTPISAPTATPYFEVTTGAVAYDQPFGPTVFNIGSAAGLISPGQQAFYNSLSNAGKDAFIENVVNQQVAAQGYDTLGLSGSGIPAQLLAGGWTATHWYSWTEFEISPVDSSLLVTVWGVPWYEGANIDVNAIANLNPALISQFRVQAVPAPTMATLLGVVAAAGLRRRRR